MQHEIKELTLNEILDQSIKLIQNNFKLLFGISLPVLFPCSLVYSAVNVFMQPKPPKNPTQEAANAFTQDMAVFMAYFIPLTLILIYIVIPITNAALTHAVARVYLNEPTSVGQSFMLAARRALPLAWTWFLMLFAVMGGFLLCIVPGILATLWFALATQIVILEGLSGFAALKRSKLLMKDNMGKLFLMAFIVAMITGSISGILGGIAGVMGQPHLQVLLQALAQTVGAVFGAATGVLFYFSARCKHENFDLTLLAQSVATADGAVVDDTIGTIWESESPERPERPGFEDDRSPPA